MLFKKFSSVKKLKLVTPPEVYEGDDPAFFLAGGISGTENWQEQFIFDLTGFEFCDWAIMNPRHSNFQNNEESARKQIQWEYQHLYKASLIVFFFPKESVCPIALYELGAWSKTCMPIIIGMSGDYPRALDVEVQTGLVRKNIPIVYGLQELVKLTESYIRDLSLSSGSLCMQCTNRKIMKEENPCQACDGTACVGYGPYCCRCGAGQRHDQR